MHWVFVQIPANFWYSSLLLSEVIDHLFRRHASGGFSTHSHRQPCILCNLTFTVNERCSIYVNSMLVSGITEYISKKRHLMTPDCSKISAIYYWVMVIDHGDDYSTLQWRPSKSPCPGPNRSFSLEDITACQHHMFLMADMDVVISFSTTQHKEHVGLLGNGLK